MTSRRFELPGVCIRAADDAARSADVVASTRAVDSYDEIVAQDWRLDRYRANPVVLWGHDNESLPIGFAEDVRVSERGLEARIRFVDEAANPLAERIYQGVRQGSIRGVSVGFKPGGTSKQASADGKARTVLESPELIELSVVAIPANPETTIQAVREWRAAREEIEIMAKEAASAEGTETKAIDCPKCGASNPDGAKFCNACGAELGGAPAQESAPAPEKSAIADLRRKLDALTSMVAERELADVAPAQRAALLKIADGDVTKLRGVASVFASKHAPSRDLPASGHVEHVERVELSEPEQRVIRAFGVSAEDYAKVRAKRAAKLVKQGWPDAVVRAVLSSTALNPMFTTFEVAFDQAYAATPTPLTDIAMVTKSNGAANVYSWIEQQPEMREWIGERQLITPIANGQILTNKPYEASIALKRVDLDDEQLGLFSSAAKSLGERAKLLPEKLLTDRLIYGSATSGANYLELHDGKPLFSATHPLKKGSSTSQSNLLTSTALTAANLATAAASMRKFKDGGGVVMGLEPTHLIVPAELWSTAKTLCDMDVVQGTSAGISNVSKGLVKYIVAPRLSADSATTWYLVSAGGPVKPLVWQERDPVEFVTSASDSPEMLERDEFRFLARRRGAAGASLWFLSMRCEA